MVSVSIIREKGAAKPMIIDFQHHFVPRELAPEGSAEGKTVYDAHGVPSYSFHSLLPREKVLKADEYDYDALLLEADEPADQVDELRARRALKAGLLARDGVLQDP
jgi:hypothetical protein